MSEQKTAEQRMRAYFKPVPMTEAERLPDPDLLTPGDLRARIEALSLPVDANSTPYPVLLHKDANSYRAGWCDAIRQVLALLGAAQEQP